MTEPENPPASKWRIGLIAAVAAAFLLLASTVFVAVLVLMRDAAEDVVITPSPSGSSSQAPGTNQTPDGTRVVPSPS